MSGLVGLIPAARAWPQDKKDERAAAIWDGAGMEALGAFLGAHKPYFDLAGLRDWLRRGHEVGFHTHSHPFCSQLNDELLEGEVIAPVAELKATLGLNDVALAYPFGDRCRPEHERTLRERRVFSALIGTAGFSRVPPDPWALERVEGEAGVDREIFGKPIVRSYR